VGFISLAVVCVDGCDSTWFETLEEDGGQLLRSVSAGCPKALEGNGFSRSSCSAGPETSTSTSRSLTANQARLNNKVTGDLTVGIPVLGKVSISISSSGSESGT
jgi:hypothetical protein